MTKDNLMQLTATACKKAKFIRIRTSDFKIIFAEGFKHIAPTPRGVAGLEFESVYIFNYNGTGDTKINYVVPYGMIEDIEFSFS